MGPGTLGGGPKGGRSLISAASICSGVRSVGSPVWVLMCCWRTRALAYFLWQTGHWWNILMGGLDLWTPMWVFKLPLVVKALEQILHLKGLSRVWVL